MKKRFQSIPGEIFFTRLVFKWYTCTLYNLKFRILVCCVQHKGDREMKRSEINKIIRGAERFMARRQFLLPPWASWTKNDWVKNKDSINEIVSAGLGWDITDFGSGKFLKQGLVLVTIRNGGENLYGKPYAEKIMVVQEKQETPLHFHWNKMEDIINRGGGNLCFQLYGSTADEELSTDPVKIQVDGIEKTIPAGGMITLSPGESLTLMPGIYHRFYAEEGKGPVLTGEVSMVNDDAADNRFYEAPRRFPEIEEDEPPYRYLTMDYT